MRLRILASTALIALTAVVLLGAPLAYLLDRVARDATRSRLERSAAQIALAIEPTVVAGGLPDRERLEDLTPSGDMVVLRTDDGARVEAGASIEGRTISAEIDVTPSATLELVAPAAPVDADVQRSVLVLVGVAGGVMVTSVALALFQARSLSRPIDELARVARRLGAGDFSAAPPRSGVAEIDALADTLDASRTQIAELLEAERRFSANASHQLRSALTGLALQLEELAGSADPDARAEASAALTQVARLDATIDELLRLARTGRAGERTTFDLAAMARDHVRDWRRRYRQAHRRIELRAEGPVTVHATAGTAGQVIDVLLSNALVHGRGSVVLHLRNQPDHGILQVSDEGPGIDPATVDRLFQPGGGAIGHGIGLPLARQLAQADGGSLELLTPRPSVFRLQLPSRPLNGPGPADS